MDSLWGKNEPWLGCMLMRRTTMSSEGQPACYALTWQTCMGPIVFVAYVAAMLWVSSEASVVSQAIPALLISKLRPRLATRAPTFWAASLML